MSDAAEARAAGLACWSGPVEPEPLSGGITNANFSVVDGGRKFFVRIGDDIPVHGILRSNEQAASRAAHAAGVSPEVIHAEPGALVLAFVEGRTFAPEDVQQAENLEPIVRLLRRCHDEIPMHFRGPCLAFWVFQVVRDYANTLRDAASRMVPDLPRLTAAADALEAAVGPVRLVFGHNDLLAANFIDDGARLWLIDWDYAGLNSPLFDLGGLVSNNELSVGQERAVLEAYFEAPADDGLMRRYTAMKCASLLRESMWSMVSEIHSSLDFDYVAYTTENLARFERACLEFEAM